MVLLFLSRYEEFPVKILIISGFLGAGKTTFIQTLVRKTQREIVVLENEYGSFGVDGDILRNDPESDKINVWEMTEGCICCSTKRDFAESVLTIANTIDPEYLVIEPTGVGALSNIIQNLRQIEYERITLLAPVTIVDGNSCERYLREYGDLYKDQLEHTRRIIVSKMEQADEQQCRLLEKRLGEFNASAPILTAHYSKMEDEWWQRLLDTKYDGSSLAVADSIADQLPDSLSLREIGLNAPEQAILFLEQLVREDFGAIIRAKGCIRAGNILLRFDVADGLYTVTGAGADMEPRAVFIGRDIRRQELRKVLYSDADKVTIRALPADRAVAKRRLAVKMDN